MANGRNHSHDHPGRSKNPWEPSLEMDLGSILQMNPVQPKVLLCPSHSQGNMWLERYAGEHGFVYNVSVETMASFVLETAKLRLAEEGLSYLNAAAETYLIHSLLAALKEGGEPLLADRTLSTGLVKAFRGAVADLRQAGVKSQGLQESVFENAQKGRLVQGLLLAYEEYLIHHQCIDYAGVVELAVDELTRKEHSQSGQETLMGSPFYLVPQSLGRTLDVVTGKLLDTLVLQQQAVIFADPYGTRALHEVGGETPPDAGSSLHRPSARVLRGRGDYSGEASGLAGELIGGLAGGVDFFAAAGELAEAREVFRRILTSGTPFDQVEIVVPGWDEVLAIYTVAANLQVPVRFAPGLPVTVARLGELASVFVDWLAANYEVSHLLAAMRQGILRIQDKEIAEGRFIQALVEANVGWGRTRYATALLRRADQLSESKPDVARALRRLHEEFAVVLELLPEEAGSGSLKDAVFALEEFVSRFGRVTDEQDAQVLTTLREFRQTVAGFPAFEMAPEVVLQYLRDLLSTMHVGQAARPQPGAAYVTSLSQGGLAGRSRTYLMGMSEGKWALPGLQDPILLDEERRRIHEGLLTTEQRVKELEAERQALFGMLAGDVTLSYSAVAVEDGKVEGPAPEMLQVYRQQVGDPGLDYSAFLDFLGEPIGYAGAHTALDETDVWFERLRQPGGLLRDGRQQLLCEYPSLRAGDFAEHERQQSSLYTGYDGLIETSLGRIETGYFSPTALETLAKCPRQFFFQRLLRLHPPEETAFDRSRWLDALQRGSLYHDIYQVYMAWVADGHAHDEAQLMAICEQMLARYGEEIPYPSPHVRDMESAEIRRAMKKFLALERQRQGVVVYLEQEIGHWQTPFPVDLGEGVSLPLFGKVDRLDRIGPHQYRIYDYKTGSDYGFSQNAYFQGGQRLQHALYAVAIEQWLKDTGEDDTAQVVASSYVFTTDRARQDEVTYPQNRRAELRTLVVALQKILDTGVFVATADAGNCTFCDFASICTARAAQESKAKRDEVGNEPIVALLSGVNRHD